MGRSTGLPLRHLLRRVLARLLNRNLPASRRIELRSGWPLYFMPLLLFMQLLGPSPVWIALLVSLVTVYAVSYIWLRVQVPHIFFERRREGSMLVVGDALQERFLLRNDSQLPLHWLEFADGSRLPGYNPRQVVSCGPGSSYQWRAEAQCGQRGVFRLGPFVLRTGDPFGLFSLEMAYAESETILVFPRVALMPALDLPRGNLSGRDRRRKAYSGSERAPVVRAYRPGDSLRHVHWPSSARQGELIVTEVETEPSGDLWIVLDVNRRVQSGEASTSTLETGIVLAASAAAEYLGGGERRSVGLLTSPARRSGWEADALAGASPAFGLEGLAAEAAMAISRSSARASRTPILWPCLLCPARVRSGEFWLHLRQFRPAICRWTRCCTAAAVFSARGRLSWLSPRTLATMALTGPLNCFICGAAAFRQAFSR